MGPANGPCPFRGEPLAVAGGCASGLVYDSSGDFEWAVDCEGGEAVKRMIE